MNIIRVSKSENVTWDQLASNALEHVNSTEDHLSNICQGYGSYIRKAAKYRDASDDLALAFHDFSGSSSISENKSMKPCLQQLADCMATLGDLRANHVNLLSTNVIKKLSHFGPICRKYKSDIKNLEKCNPHSSSAKTKSTFKLGRGSRESIANTDSDINSNNSELMEEMLINFERNKLITLKNILKDFTRSELIYHCKAIEVLTEVTKSIEDLNTCSDLEDFKSRIKITNNSVKTESIVSNSENNQLSLEDRASRMALSTPQGPGTYYQHTIIGGTEDDSSLEYSTDFSQSQD